MCSSTNHRARGFTLIELLVVIAIIAVLIALLLPAIQKVRESANRTTCINNLSQFGLAQHNYESPNGGFSPAVYFTSPTDKTGISWVPLLFPYIEQGNLQYDLTVPWSHANNNVNVNPKTGVVSNQYLIKLLI